MDEEIDYIPFGEFRQDFKDKRHSSRVYHDCVIEIWPYQVQVTPTALQFAEQETGTVSATKNGTIKNVGHRNLRNLAVKVVGDFTVSGSVPSVLAPGESTVVKIAFAPKRPGRTTGGLHVEADNIRGHDLIELIGNGEGDPVDPPDPEPTTEWDHVADINGMLNGLWGFIQRAVGDALTGEGPNVSVPSSTVTFSTSVPVGGQSPVVEFVITNSGTENLVLDNFAVTGDFEMVP